ncbi:glycosyltransferase [Bacteroides sp. 51]|uniref:glycosyltransferase n=1 Tax=Bacteroides sp. 51 TaxID=2302938 RepID=UPI0013CF5677|nr:glycosyltransferase [Bacteroides sp. 51]NDV81535.1 glycosyltransferase family 2 protein [Bacteroides sp. 51]
MRMIYSKGISVIICCYNSGWIIKKTLDALIKQRKLEDLNWEIIVVDNACTDNTVDVVREFILSYPTVKIQLVSESRPGLIYAREKGISVSKYSHLLFCDDDNILCETYLTDIFRIMNSDSKIAACGGLGIATFLMESPPKWFNDFCTAYAIGTQLDELGLVRDNFLYGAACCFSHEALDKLYAAGFNPVLTGRLGDKLLAGDDSELTKSLMLLNYKLVASNDLRFEHVIHSKRLSFDYLLKMYRGFGISAVILDLYNKALEGKTVYSKKEHWKNMFLVYLRVLYYNFGGLFNCKHKVYSSYINGVLVGYKNWKYGFLKNKFNNIICLREQAKE